MSWRRPHACAGCGAEKREPCTERCAYRGVQPGKRRLCAVGSGMHAGSLPKVPGMPWLAHCPECGRTLDLNGGIYLPRHYLAIAR